MLTLTAPEPTTQLAALVAETGLSLDKSAIITARFSDYETKSADWAAKSLALCITDESQTAEMKMAREGRLFLRGLRLSVESTRKELKDDYLQGGRAVDNVAKYLTGLIQPTEKYLEEQETFAIRAAAERREARRAARHAALVEYTADPNVYVLADLSEEAFMELLNGFVAAREAKIEAERKAEADRVAAAEAETARVAAEAAAREAQRVENEGLKAEATAREAAMTAEREAADTARIAAAQAAEALRRKDAEKAADERRKIEAAAAAERAVAEEELRKEREAAEALRLAAAAIEAAAATEAAARATAEKKAQAAPDREKLLALAALLDTVALPELATPEAKQIIADVKALMGKVQDYILKKADMM